MVIKTRAWLHTLQDVYAHRISENLLLLHTPQPCESNAEGCWDAFGLRVAQWGIQNSSKLTVRQALSQFMGFDWFQMISDDFRCQLSCGPNDCATQRFERIAGASRTGFFISGRSHRCASVCVRAHFGGFFATSIDPLTAQYSGSSPRTSAQLLTHAWHDA